MFLAIVAALGTKIQTVNLSLLFVITGGKLVHLAKVCNSKPNGQQGSKKGTFRGKHKASASSAQFPKNERASSEGGSQVHALFKVGSKSSKPFCITVLVNGLELSMEINIGAAVSVISEGTFKSVWPGSSKPRLVCSMVELRTYSGQTLCVLGKTVVNVSFNNSSAELELIVVSGDGPTLLGRDWLTVLEIDVSNCVQAVHSVHSSLSFQPVLD